MTWARVTWRSSATARMPTKRAELANVALIGAARVPVADVGGPFDFRGDVGQALELRGGQPPALALAAVPLGARHGARLGDCQLPVHGGSRCLRLVAR